MSNFTKIKAYFTLLIPAITIVCVTKSYLPLLPDTYTYQQYGNGVILIAFVIGWELIINAALARLYDIGVILATISLRLEQIKIQNEKHNLTITTSINNLNPENLYNEVARVYNEKRR